jgi:ribosomal protein S12 methylthiotransferase
LTLIVWGTTGETQEDFNILKEFVQEMKFDRMGCFALSHEGKHTYYLLEMMFHDTGKTRSNNGDCSLSISWDLNQEKIDKPTVVLLIEKKGAQFYGTLQFISPKVWATKY